MLGGHIFIALNKTIQVSQTGVYGVIRLGDLLYNIPSNFSTIESKHKEP